MTTLILLHRSKFVAPAVPQQLQQCIDSLFQKKGFFGSLLRDVGGPSPNISGEPFQDKTIRKLSGEEWEEGESYLVFLITWIHMVGIMEIR